MAESGKNWSRVANEYSKVLDGTKLTGKTFPLSKTSANPFTLLFVEEDPLNPVAAASNETLKIVNELLPLDNATFLVDST
jgi:hypothetical protein